MVAEFGQQPVMMASIATRTNMVSKAGEPPPAIKIALERKKERKAGEKKEREKQEREKRERETREREKREREKREREKLERERRAAATAGGGGGGGGGDSAAISPLPPPRPTAQQFSPSPPGSVRQLKKLLRQLKSAQAQPGQEPAALAARAFEIEGYEADLA